MSKKPATKLSPDELKALLYTLDELLPPQATHYDISLLCAFIVDRYGVPVSEAESIYASCLGFLRHRSRLDLDHTPPLSDREIN